ncbi:MAG: L-serine ammonia-lyase, iron-sulfur-dependent subunit beta [Caldicoprobacterales bacterium]|jgi:L-serine dehydratase|nr:L-serine ammonia-lyase, iron-sulfur-dependent, subunit beta [Clostridiales bacterium]
MNVFDIIGPIMVGPSSSHTAGAARIGKIVRNLLGQEPVEAIIELHGSFAQTYKGHGTDRAIIGGLLGFDPHDLRIRDSLNIAAKQGFHFTIKQVNLKDAHPNTARISVRDGSGKRVVVTAASVGGGNVVVRDINGLEVDFTGRSHTIIIPHKDAPGVVASVTGLLSSYNINIGKMKVYRKRRGGEAIMVIEVDQEIDQAVADKLIKLPCVNEVTVLNPL